MIVFCCVLLASNKARDDGDDDSMSFIHCFVKFIILYRHLLLFHMLITHADGSRVSSPIAIIRLCV